MDIVTPPTSPMSPMSPSSCEADEVLPDLAAQFNKNIRPLLDTIDELRNLKVTSEGIPLPTIVVVGDQSSGKSSVLESLAGISLPKGLGIATRVPLVLRLQSCPAPESSIYISYKDNNFRIDEGEIREAVDEATKALAGDGKDVIDAAISLHIRKPNAPDLTMIDLPGITRVPVAGQPHNIYEKIAAMIRHYLKPPETVILNVLSATTDFSTSESIRMSKEVDKSGERSLAVVTKVDKAPDDVYDRVTANDVKIGLGYICVRNRIDDDLTHEAARKTEKRLFDTHPTLSLLDKRSVGIPALAERLATIQAKMIRSRLPFVEKEIDKALSDRQNELDGLPIYMDHLGDGDPMELFSHIMHQNMNRLQDFMRHGNYDGFLDQDNMHYPARLEGMCKTLSAKLFENLDLLLSPRKTEEIRQRMENYGGCSLPNILPPTLLRTLVSEEIDKVSDLCYSLVSDAHSYAARFANDAVEKCTSSFPILWEAYKQIATRVLASSLLTCKDFVHRTMAKERSTVCTLNKLYMTNVLNLQNHLDPHRTNGFRDSYPQALEILGVTKSFSFSELRYKSAQYILAFELKMNLVVYMSVVYARMADELTLEVRYSLEDALLEKLHKGLVAAAKGQPMSYFMQEHSSSFQNRINLLRRVDILKYCKEILRKVL